MVLTSWALVAFLMSYSYVHEKEYKEENIRRQLSLFSSRIISAYKSGIDVQQFLNMLSMMIEDTSYSGVRVSVFFPGSDSNVPKYYIGRPIDRDYLADNAGLGVDDRNAAVTQSRSGELFYYKISKGNVNDILVYTALPYDPALEASLKSTSTSFWIILFLLLALVTFIAYKITDSISSNISMLRDFAVNANNRAIRFDETQFPHNELGDISREIVRLYRERGEALERSKREHKIAIHAVEDKTRIKRQMTNNINHELKTPVGVIKGYLDTVLSSDDMDDEMRNYFLRRAQDNVDRLCNLLNDVSTMTRLEEGSGNIPKSTINFHDLIFAVENDFNAAGMFGNMKFSFEIPMDCEIKGNNNLLSSAISNLIKNAVLHSHGTEMGIRLLSQSKKYYTFMFWDNGTGVDPVHIPHLFDRFYRVDSGRSRKTGGTGLGLPIVKNIIESLGGSLSVSNRSQGGLQFMFTLVKA
ncbi:MAG: HAMP domain-containing histidine kinase [Bacteroides sp.]|nr:HAMP domain-containing histidine kinase [Bacteroides sp.]MCM1412825.1 HAMP domain-containing histidine kinase [Bacteroides sp.]MCM1471494.1 HAMP domain-containing histidine kinase [Bacteroides sp.]